MAMIPSLRFAPVTPGGLTAAQVDTIFVVPPIPVKDRGRRENLAERIGFEADDADSESDFGN